MCVEGRNCQRCTTVQVEQCRMKSHGRTEKRRQGAGGGREVRRHDARGEG